jgi:ligand-binding sensor domain-containing protein
MPRSRIKLFLLLFLLSTKCAFTQLRFEPVFDHIEPDKLGVQKVIWQDWNKNGIMWGIYESGIFRYDGFSVKKITAIKDDSSTLLDPKIQNALIDSKNNLWIAYDNRSGLSCLNTITGKIKHFLPDSTNKNSIPDYEVASVKEDSKGNIWILTWGGGFCKVNKETGKFKIYLPHKLVGDRRDETRNRVKDFCELPDGRLLIIYFTNEIFGYFPEYFDPVKEKFEKFPFEHNLTNCNDSAIRKINAALKIGHFGFYDNENKYWFGTYSALICVDTKKHETYRVTAQKDDSKLNLDNAKTYVTDENGYLWVSTVNYGC